jgi:hypothetical protein
VAIVVAVITVIGSVIVALIQTGVLTGRAASGSATPTSSTASTSVAAPVPPPDDSSSVGESPAPTTTSPPSCTPAASAEHPRIPDLLGRQVLIESVNNPNMFMQFHEGEVLLRPLTAGSEEEASFVLERGLADPDMISLRFAGEAQGQERYLRHEDYLLKVERPDGTALSAQDATFHVSPGLADSNAFSFRACAHEYRYIRHASSVFHVTDQQWIPGYSAEVFRGDATFLVHDADES